MIITLQSLKEVRKFEFFGVSIFSIFEFYLSENLDF